MHSRAECVTFAKQKVTASALSDDAGAFVSFVG